MHKETSKARWRVGFAGGGSGGHSIPLLAIADECLRAVPHADLYFVTTNRSVEADIIARKGYTFFRIPSGKLNGQSPLVILSTFLKMPIAILKSIWIILGHRPDVVISAGGYAGAPYLLAARLMGVRTFVYEQNSSPGMAVRWLSRFADTILLNYSSAASYFPSKQVFTVGLPCRSEMSSVRWSEKDPRWDSLPFRIFVTGGSQGATGLNRIVLEAIAELPELHGNLIVQHQTGQNDLANVREQYQSLPLASVAVEPFVQDMQEAYGAAHLVISRAGASTLVELAAAAKASVLVPLVSKDGHQVPNAQECEDAQAARMLLQRPDAGAKLREIIAQFYQDRPLLRQYAGRMGERYVPDAAAKIVAHLREPN